MSWSGKSLEERSDMRDKLPLYKRVVWLYALALGAAGVGTLIAVDRHPKINWLRTDGPNFGTDLVGLALGLLLVDRLVAWRCEGDLFPRRQGAIRRIGEAARSLEVFLIWSYKAASPQGSPEPQSIEGLIDA